MTPSSLVWNQFMASSLETVGVPNMSDLAASVLDILARASKDNIEVHAVDTDTGVIHLANNNVKWNK